MKVILISITQNRKTQEVRFNLPESWGEVPANVYPELASIYLKKSDEMDVHDKTVRAFLLLTIEHYKVIKRLSDEELYDLLKNIDWVFNKLDILDNPLPVVVINGKDYYGPQKAMENLRFAEWCVADTHFVNYSHTAALEDLQKLAACIYRPSGIGDEFKHSHPSYRGDIRERFNDQLVDQRSAEMSKLGKAYLEGIYLFYASCRHHIISMYEDFFPQKEKKEGEAPAKSDFSWFDIYDDLRGDPKFGGPDKLEDEFLHTVLASVERTQKTMKELRRTKKA
jgi:hypothetical protein